MNVYHENLIHPIQGPQEQRTLAIPSIGGCKSVFQIPLESSLHHLNCQLGPGAVPQRIIGKSTLPAAFFNISPDLGQKQPCVNHGGFVPSAQGSVDRLWAAIHFSQAAVPLACSSDRLLAFLAVGIFVDDQTSVFLAADRTIVARPDSVYQ